MGVARENFSQACIEVFGVNFDNAPTLIVRSEFIKTKGSNTHFLRKTAKKYEPMTSGRGTARSKHIGTRMSEKAMQSGSLLGN